MKTKFFWCIISLIILGLILALAWEHGQIKGQGEQLQLLQKAVQDLRDENFQLRTRLSDLIQIGHELRSMPYSNMGIKAALMVTQLMLDKSAQYYDTPVLGPLQKIHYIPYFKIYYVRLTPGLITSLIRIESAGNSGAISKADCYGLMQLLPTTAMPLLDKLGFNVAYGDDIKELLFVPTVNVAVGIQELVRLRILHLGLGIDSWHITFMAYLYGPGVPGLKYAHAIITRREEMRGRGIT